MAFMDASLTPEILKGKQPDEGGTPHFRTRIHQAL